MARGTDLLFYAVTIAFVFTTLSTYLRFKELELKYARARAGRRAGGRTYPGKLAGLPAEVVDRAPHTLLEGDPGVPAEHHLRLADIQAGPGEIPEAGRRELRVIRAPTAFATTVCNARSLVSTPVPMLKR